MLWTDLIMWLHDDISDNPTGFGGNSSLLNAWLERERHSHTSGETSNPNTAPFHLILITLKKHKISIKKTEREESFRRV